MIYTLFLIPITTLFTIFVVAWYNKPTSFFTSRQNNSGKSLLIMLTTLISLYANLMYTAFLWNRYPMYDQDGFVVYPANFFFELHHNLNLPFIILSTGILIIATLTVWYSTVNKFLFSTLILFS